MVLTALAEPITFMHGFSEPQRDSEVQWIVWDKFLVDGSFSEEPFWKRKAKALNFGKSLAHTYFQYTRKRIEEALAECKPSEQVTLTLPWWEGLGFDEALYGGYAWLCTYSRLNWLMRGLVYTSRTADTTITITLLPTDQTG